MGNHVEWRNGTLTKYYYVGSTRVAMREGDTLSFILANQLGSATVTLDSTGSLQSELRYHPFGETRHSDGTTPTNRRFTGQIQDEGTGLYYYNARYYDPSLGRFIQADTIVPEPGNPQSLNRYSYVLNNPLKYTDPSGYDPLDEQWRQAFVNGHGREPDWRDEQIRLFSLAYGEEWFGQNSWSSFYHPNGQLNMQGYIDVFAQAPESRSWDTLGNALLSLGASYEDHEEELFVRDVASLYAGLPSRRSENGWFSAPFYTHGGREHVFLQPGTLDERFFVNPNGGFDADANVHHWAWAFAMGYTIGEIAATGINTGRETFDIRQRQGEWLGVANQSDIDIGNAGIGMAGALSLDQGIQNMPALLNRWLGVGP